MQQKYFQGLSPAGFHRIAYCEWGKPDARRTIICVHGLTRNSRDFDPLAEALCDKARIVSVDIVGRGKSEWLPDPSLYQYTQYVADMTALIARLEVEEVDWVGTSMGGLIGILLAAQTNTPIRRLVLNDVGPVVPLAAIQRIAGYIGQDPVFKNVAEVEAMLRYNYAVSGPMSDENFRHIAAHSYRKRTDGTLGLAYDPSIAKSFAAIKADVDLWPYYDRIICPTLVIHGEISDVLLADTAKEMTKRGPKAKLAHIPGIGHIPGLADAHQIGLIREFLGL